MTLFPHYKSLETPVPTGVSAFLTLHLPRVISRVIFNLVSGVSWVFIVRDISFFGENGFYGCSLFFITLPSGAQMG